jgi:hypothetical protein
MLLPDSENEWVVHVLMCKVVETRLSDYSYSAV